mmetsp:Transcript_81401/g.225423  ORF Transcript_81401/g.225423 Transcript_81401/m.225423 type:complete len:230 (+) Transcript_81401:1378-2067(+)
MPVDQLLAGRALELQLPGRRDASDVMLLRVEEVLGASQGPRHEPAVFAGHSVVTLPRAGLPSTTSTVVFQAVAPIVCACAPTVSAPIRGVLVIGAGIFAMIAVFPPVLVEAPAVSRVVPLAAPLPPVLPESRTRAPPAPTPDGEAAPVLFFALRLAVLLLDALQPGERRTFGEGVAGPGAEILPLLPLVRPRQRLEGQFPFLELEAQGAFAPAAENHLVPRANLRAVDL